MPLFRTEKEKILVDTYAVDVYVPEDYVGAAYRGTSYYSVIGTQVRYFAVANMRIYRTEKEFKDPMSVPVYPLGIPMTIMCKPTEIDTREVQFTSGGPLRKCVVLTFYKNNEFVSNTAAIASNNHIMILLNRLMGGKLTNVPPTVIAQIIPDAEKMNFASLRISPEELEMYIAERFHDPDNPRRKLRFADHVDPDSDRAASYRMREEAMQDTTFQAITHEDPNNAFIVSINRTRKGIFSQPTITERITRGLPIDDLNKQNQAIYQDETDKTPGV